MIIKDIKCITSIFAIILSCFSTPAQADPQADARYIVNQTVTQTMFEGALKAQRPLIISAIQHDLSAKRITLPDPDRFLDLFMEEFMGEFTQSMRNQSSSIYLDNFSGQELSDIADFFKTDSGQALISATPILMNAGAEMGQRGGQQAGVNASKRLAARIKKEGLIVTEDPSLMSQLLDLLK